MAERLVHLRRNVLCERASRRDVDDLEATADGEQGQAAAAASIGTGGVTGKLEHCERDSNG